MLGERLEQFRARPAEFSPHHLGDAQSVAAGVVIAIVLGQPVGPVEGVGSTPTATGAPVVGTSIPTPQIAGPPTSDGSTVTFTFTNPDPQPDDLFVWRISNRTDSEPLHRA